MASLYPHIKALHVAMVLASVCVFALRGAGSLAGQRWPMARPVRWLSYAVDTTLLAAALVLLAILPRGLFANGWLAVKVGLLVVYIVLGFSALRVRGPAAGARAAVCDRTAGVWMDVHHRPCASPARHPARAARLTPSSSRPAPSLSL
jgi:uncharacterized membrane protein SirB2